MSKNGSSTPNIALGSLLAVAGFFCMALFGILTKVALEQGSFIWVSFIAYLTAALLLLPYVVSQGCGYLRSSHYLMLLGRALFGTTASFLYTVAIQYIPVVNGTLLFNTAPIFIPLMALLFLHKPSSRPVWLAVALGFVGILFIIKPTAALFTQTGNIIGLLSGLCLAIAYLLMKQLTASDSGVRIIFYYLAIGTLMQLPLLLWSETPPPRAAFYAALSGGALCSAQLALVTAYRYADAAQVGVYQYSSVVFVGLLEWLLWGLSLGGWDLLGITLVALAGMVIIRSNRLNHSDKGATA